nr:cytochrome c [Mucilaginibacter straminoryzae]
MVICFFSVAATVLTSCSEQDLEYKRAYTNGSLVYQQHCQNCHGNDGEGLSALIPPLTDSIYYKKNSAQLACLIKNGSSGLMIVGDKAYTDKMPPSGLAPIEISQVLTYIRNSFGNKHGIVSVDEVNKDLEGCN